MASYGMGARQEQHPEGITTLPGYIWLDTPGKAQHVREDTLEFTVEP